MDIAIFIFSLIALIAVIAVCMVAIKTLKRLELVFSDVQSTLDDTRKVAVELQKNLPQTFQQINEISKHLNHTMVKVDSQLDVVSEGVEQFRSIGTRINQLEERLQGKIEQPLMQAANLVSGVSKAVSAFTNGLKRK
jgi:uncharacterized protein YoxC